jgi:hypothetical protein
MPSIETSNRDYITVYNNFRFFNLSLMINSSFLICFIAGLHMVLMHVFFFSN